MIKKVAVLSFITFSLSLPIVTFADFTFTEVCNLANPTQWFNCVFGNVLAVVVWPVFVGLVFTMFIWAGVLFLTAQGDPGKLETARKAVIWAVVGVVVGIFAFSAYATIKWILGIA